MKQILTRFYTYLITISKAYYRKDIRYYAIIARINNEELNELLLD